MNQFDRLGDQVVQALPADLELGVFIDGDPEVDVLELLENAIGVTVHSRVHCSRSFPSPPPVALPIPGYLQDSLGNESYQAASPSATFRLTLFPWKSRESGEIWSS